MENSVQLIMKINFISSLDTGKFLMHTKSDNIEIMSGIETNDIMNERFKSFLKRYQVELETKMKGSGFISERVDLLYYMINIQRRIIHRFSLLDKKQKSNNKSKK